jgi:hypothetical protein
MNDATPKLAHHGAPLPELSKIRYCTHFSRNHLYRTDDELATYQQLFVVENLVSWIFRSAREAIRSRSDDAAWGIDILHGDLVGRRHHQATFGRRNPIAAHDNNNLVMNAGEWAG